MNNLIKTLFCENPYLMEQVYAYCKTFPGYTQAERTYEALAEQMRQTMGKEFYFAYEEALNAYMAREVHAYYLFGLGLRQELLASLG